MFNICLFDLDDTLVRTDDLKDIRESCKNNANAKNLKAVRDGLARRQDRRVYTLDALTKIRTQYPKLKLGIFTRSPHSYAETVLTSSYPGFEWDIVVAYEDVSPTKPHGDGIDLAMNKFKVQNLDQVVLVGDTDVDVRAAYNCGCVAILDRSAWPAKKRSEHWRALEYVPDALVDTPEELLKALAKPNTFLPELERLLAGEKAVAAGVRFDRINHFVPRAIGGDNKAFPVHVCGRSLTQYESLKHRRKWHNLTQSIVDHKDADRFPESWIDAIRHFIVDQYPAVFVPANVLVTVVPHRPERKHRLGELLKQLQESVAQKPIKSCNVAVAPDLLAFKDGVKSQHNDHLNRDQRFTNVRDHLVVRTPQFVAGSKSVLVLDDVVTTGASLIYATTYLKAAGAGDVRCLAIAKSVGDVL
jgi:HAD superfamily hydrolase (TIGR01509 family)